MLVAIDHSLRSTAVVAFTDAGALFEYAVLSPDKSYDNEPLILYQWAILADLLEAWDSEETITHAILEGLSFGAKGNRKDLQTGLFWWLRTSLWAQRPKTRVDIVPVARWRSFVLSKEEQKEAKKIPSGLKKACVDKLPHEVKAKFLAYLKEEEPRLRATKQSQWKDCIYDLTDAYWIGHYALFNA
jgi:hypothetical protein